MMSSFIFQRLDEQSYESRLKHEYEEHKKKSGCSYFKGQPDEAQDTDEKGEPMRLSAEALEDNEDELIRLMHDKFLNGDDKEHFNYEDVDFNSEYDDKKAKG